MKKTLALLFALILTSAALAQNAATTTVPPTDPQNNNQHIVIDVVQKQAPEPLAQKANEWVDVGRNVGTAIGSGLKAVAHDLKDETFGKGVSLVDGLDKVSHTDAGRFTMAVIAWKVAGADAMQLLHRLTGVVVGVPLAIVFFCIAIWITRRFAMVRSVRTEVSGGPWWSKTRVIKYQIINGNLDQDDRMAIVILTWIIALLVIWIDVGVVIL